MRGEMSEKNGEVEALTQHTKVILVAIQESKTALENQIATLAGEVGLLRCGHNKLKDRVKATEEMVNETTPKVKTLTQQMARMDADLKILAMKEAYKATIRGEILAGEVGERRQRKKRLVTLETELIALERQYATQLTQELKKLMNQTRKEFNIVTRDEVRQQYLLHSKLLYEA
ncbi:hypothetical protein NDU88_002835 [Pleurodeles waltl]|uniref:Uncharacterized protein n=1 Tax=Pleurodeles waltl TaxID=8319 RepID=A0AAV7LJX7_PLEWA|nr:hypothetical protein NDU88_002835 [Pleurodeles waltl]